MNKESCRNHPIKNVMIGTAAVFILAAVLFLLWWFGMFLPHWIGWQELSFPYEDATVRLEDRCMKLLVNERTCFVTNRDWFVQDVLCQDINCDGMDELVLLVWKHGSYGDHLPLWVKHNDIRLEQHIFIYQWDSSRENRLKPVWMSSTLGYEVSTIARGTDDGLIVTDREDKSLLWRWEDFGLKLVGKADEETVSFLCAGDNLLHLSVLNDGASNHQYHYLYEGIQDEIRQADLASLNQETIFVKDQGLVSDYPRFGTPVEVGDAIVDAGFDIISLANNHVLDKGKYGIDTTISFYENQQDISCVGVHSSHESVEKPSESVCFREKNGICFALLSYTYGTNGIASPKDYPNMVERFTDEKRMIAQLDYARAKADVLIVYMHWGTEFSTEPDEEQHRLSDLLQEHGVDVVIGTHPHVLQPYEIKTSKNGHQMLIYYSLGNLISGQDQKECRTGGLARFTVVKAPKGEISIRDESLEKVITEWESGHPYLQYAE